jgi:predicted DNA-binding transcriptional regulator YafY
MSFRSGLYLFAYVEEYQQIRTFAVERIESIQKLGDHFEKPSDFTVESYLGESFGLIKEDATDVEVIFGADIAEYVRSRVWHASQQVREIGGGRINLKMHVGGEFELTSWILSFGASATVVGPERLRRRVETELVRAAESYRTEKTVMSAGKSKKVDIKKSAATATRRG